MTPRLALLALLALPAAAETRSGYTDATPETRAIQDDDTTNPGFLWVQQGETLFTQNCTACHTATEMKGVATRYPTYDPKKSRPLTLEQRINECRTERQHEQAYPGDSEPILSLTAYIGLQSRGQPMNVTATGAAQPFLEAGEKFFNLRQGQLNLSCAQCHDALAGQSLAGSRIPQGHPNGYPLYRLEWQTIGSLTRRIRNCLTGIRATPLAPDDPTLINLQLYLAARARGLSVETPAVRP